MLICWESKIRNMIQNQEDWKILLGKMVIFLYLLTIFAMVNLETIISN